jgi:hypothetical protein
MTTHAILIQNKVSADRDPALNRPAFSSGSDIDNGWVFNLQSVESTSGSLEVWDVVQPTTGSLIGLWMAASPEVVLTTLGNGYARGIDPDPRNFTNVKGYVFDAFKPQPGDIVTLTTEAIVSNPTYAFATATVDSNKFTGANNPAGTSVTCLRYLATTYISVGSGSAIGTSRVPAYKYEVLYN